MKHIIFLFCFLLLSNMKSLGQIDTITATNGKLNLKRLQEGKATYLVYFTDSNFVRKGVGDIWERNTHFSTLNHKPVVEFGWKWINKDTVIANVINICERTTMKPIFHKANYGKRGIIAYDFVGKEMIASDTVANNKVIKKPKITLNMPVLNWELDLETYPLLPIKKIGQQFLISFMDANSPIPAYHLYEVIGKEAIAVNIDTKTKCWILKHTDATHPNYYALFYLSEKSGQVIKMKEYFQGMYRFKVKLY